MQPYAASASLGRAMREATHNKLRLSVSVTARQKTALEEIAQRSEVSTSRVIQEAIKEFLERIGDKELPLFKGQPPS